MPTAADAPVRDAAPLETPAPIEKGKAIKPTRDKSPAPEGEANQSPSEDRKEDEVKSLKKEKICSIRRYKCAYCIRVVKEGSKYNEDDIEKCPLRKEGKPCECILPDTSREGVPGRIWVDNFFCPSEKCTKYRDNRYR
ncbi:hypothetical protein BU16DRAFT_261853 [Lophium mytilinum]|uniref:Uncharacterized protein n=1 Tax=Lophium mytilinum TaxID=390894 RepID=A0A6A6R6P7_9PEZI|nr:hypothetical protein BU16DRAFT_261853 [Lophium mytilinum]